MNKMLVLVVALSLGTSVFAQTKNDDKKNQSTNEEKKSDKLDLQNLEQKYWSAKDSDFQVVQNRTYSKDKRFFASLGYGVLVNDAYSYGRMTNFAGGYYFSERYGLEFSYEQGTLTKNDSTVFLINTFGASPNYNQFVDYKSVNFLFVPFYSKTSFMDKHIMYFDMQFGFGIGQMTYEIQRNTGSLGNEREAVLGYNIDFTQQLFFTEHYAFRLDIKNKWSKQRLRGYQKDTDLGTVNQQDTTILLGITGFF